MTRFVDEPIAEIQVLGCGGPSSSPRHHVVAQVNPVPGRLGTGKGAKAVRHSAVGRIRQESMRQVHIQNGVVIVVLNRFLRSDPFPIGQRIPRGLCMRHDPVDIFLVQFEEEGRIAKGHIEQFEVPVKQFGHVGRRSEGLPVFGPLT